MKKASLFRLLMIIFGILSLPLFVATLVLATYKMFIIASPFALSFFIFIFVSLISHSYYQENLKKEVTKLTLNNKNLYNLRLNKFITKNYYLELQDSKLVFHKFSFKNIKTVFEYNYKDIDNIKITPILFFTKLVFKTSTKKHVFYIKRKYKNLLEDDTFLVIQKKLLTKRIKIDLWIYNQWEINILKTP